MRNPENDQPNQENYLSTLQKIIHIAAPMGLRNEIIALRIFATQALLASSSPELLATYGSFGALRSLLFSAIFTGQRTFSVFAAQGEGSHIGKLFQHASLFSLLFSISIAAPICFSAPFIFAAANQSEKVIAESRFSFILLFFAFLADSLFRVQTRILFGRKKTVPPLLAELFQTAIDLSCISVLVEGRFGFPKAGVHAPACSYLICAFFSLIANTIYFACAPSLKEYAFFKQGPIDSALLKEITKKALPASGGAVLEMIAQLMINLYIGSINPEETAGIEVAKSFSNILGFLLIGFAAAGSILSGIALKESKAYQQIINVNLLFTVPIAAIVGSAVFIFSRLYTQLFLSENNPVFDSAVMKLRIQTLLEVFNAARVVLIGAMEAHLDASTPLKINAAGIFALNLILSTLVFICSKNASAVYATQLGGTATSSAAFFICWKKGYFKEKKPIQPAVQSSEAASPASTIEMLPTPGFETAIAAK